MIVMYHKVDIIAPTIWWVPVDTFARQLDELGDRTFVYLSDYDPNDDSHVVITFDDAYENVWRWAAPELRRRGLPFEVFVIGDYIGDWNDFDKHEPPTRFASLEHLQELAEAGGRIQWHTCTHPDLVPLDDERLAAELTVPDTLREALPSPHLDWFSYPSGVHDERVVDAVRSRFSGAVIVLEGTERDRWTLQRVTVDQHTSFA